MINLKDTAFLLLAKFDSFVRLENALAVTEYLSSEFDTKIHFLKVGSRNSGIFHKLMPKSVQYDFVEDKDPVLHRTMYINKMLDSATERYVSVWDIDVIVPAQQVEKAVELLRDGADFSYPYEHDFLDTSEEIREMYLENRSAEFLLQHKQFMNKLYPPNPVGGAYMANRESYIASGKENTRFYGWGIEDGERYMRWLSKNMKVERAEGPLFHLTHPRGTNSTMPNVDETVIKKRIYFSALRGKTWTGF